MKIYIVTRGIYDDFEILGAAFDHERAERIAETFGRNCCGDEPEITAFEDGYAQNLCCDGDYEYLYQVIMKCDAFGIPTYANAIRIECVPNEAYKNGAVREYKYSSCADYFTYVFCKSSDDAILIAKERLRRYMQKGKTDET